MLGPFFAPNLKKCGQPRDVMEEFRFDVVFEVVPRVPHQPGAVVDVHGDLGRQFLQLLSHKSVSLKQDLKIKKWTRFLVRVIIQITYYKGGVPI